MTAADEIRQAAAKVRETAKRATPGPWAASPVWSPRSSVTSAVYSLAEDAGTVASEVVASGLAKAKHGGITNPHNALWIALMSPALAEPLAAWLEGCAGEADAMAHPTDWGICDEPGSVQSALAVARLINGGAQ